MKNTQKGSAVLVLSIIIVLLVLAFGIYIYSQSNGQTTQQVNSSQTTTGNTQPITTQNTPTNQAVVKTNTTPSNQMSNLKTYTNTQYGFGFKYAGPEVIKERNFVDGGMNNFEAKTDSITVQYSPRQCGWPGYPKDNIVAYGFGKPDLDKTITLTNGYIAHVAGTKTCTECSNPDVKNPVLQATVLSKNSASLLTVRVSGKGDLQESANFLISSVLPTISLTPVFESFMCLPQTHG